LVRRNRWYGQKGSVDHSGEAMAVVLSVDSEDVYPVDMAGRISSPRVYINSVMAIAGEKLQYLVDLI